MLNHLIDQLTDVVGAFALGALDDFSDTLHDEIIVQSRAAGLTVELLDAKAIFSTIISKTARYSRVSIC